jgi:ligand-binding sensor domain-containing protein
VWFSTFGGGVSCYNLKQGKLQNYYVPELKSSYVFATKSDRTGKTWIAGTMGYPSYIYHDSLHRVSQKEQYLPQLYGVELDSSDGVWFNAGNLGIVRVFKDSVSILGVKDGLRLEKDQSIIIDKFNNLLVFSKLGLQVYNPEVGIKLDFGENSGLAYQYPILNSNFTDKEGQIWIGTQTGIIKYNPEYLQFIGQNPRVFLSVKNLFYNSISEDKNKFSYSENNFTFGYTGIWFRNPEGLNYRYMLEGFDLKWNYSNRNQNLTYSKLPAGAY